MQQANPVLLEPIYRLEVIVPDEYMGDIMSDFNTRRCAVGYKQKGNRTVVRFLVPQSEILRYGTDLRSMTQGAAFTPWNSTTTNRCLHLADEIVAQSKLEEAEA